MLEEVVGRYWLTKYRYLLLTHMVALCCCMWLLYLVRWRMDSRWRWCMNTPAQEARTLQAAAVKTA